MTMSSTGSQEFSTTRNPLPPPVYEFDTFRLEAGSRLLLRDGKPVPLPPRAIDVLAMLLAAGGRLVTKDEFLHTLWPGLAVEEGNLTQYMFLLRKALDENRDGRRYILTVPGQGYRFLAQVRDAGGEPAADGRPITVAVLPFRPVDPGQGAASLGLALSHAIVAALSAMPGIAALPACATRPYAEAGTEPLAAARELGADLLVEGVLERAAGHLRATVQVVEVARGSLVWAGHFDGRASRVFTLEDSVADCVAAHIREAASLRRRPAPVGIA
jgi:DNA-binding winged helix-turn-helix (wHTH) protein